MFNSTSQLNSISTLSAPLHPFPFYKHYFDDTNNTKTQTSSGSFYKNKKVVFRDKNDKSSLSKISTAN